MTKKFDFIKKFSGTLQMALSKKTQEATLGQKRWSFTSYILAGASILVLVVIFGSLVGMEKDNFEKVDLTIGEVVAGETNEIGGDKQRKKDTQEVEPATKVLVNTLAMADPSISGGFGVVGESDVIDADGVPKLTASAVLVRELDEPTPLLNQGPEARWPLASLTKLMTAIVALEKFGPDGVVRITDEAIAVEGTAGNFSSGEEFLVLDIIKAMMSVSSNDGAEAVKLAYDKQIGTTLEGRINSEGESSFIKAMRTKASELGMNDTAFNDVSGLSVVNQSTLGDIEKMIRYIFSRHAEVLVFSQQKTVTITDLVSGMKRSMKSINVFAGRSDFVGGKTGYTDEAKENLVSIFKDGDKRWLIIVLGSSDRFGETLRLLRWAKKQ